MNESNNYNQNSAKIYTGSSCGELRVSSPYFKKVISATNNKAFYYAELAEKYKEEAKFYKEQAKAFAEQNSDITQENLEELKLSLQKEIAYKQPIGDYALKSEIPTKISSFENDESYIKQDNFDTMLKNSFIDSQDDIEGKVLTNDGENFSWTALNTFKLFDIKFSDHILEGEDLFGWALQGTYVSKAIYPDFYSKVLQEIETAEELEITLGSSTITMKRAQNGHQYYSITDKSIVDNFFNIYGTAWFYGIDNENERIFLPRNNFFEQVTTDSTMVGKSIEAGLPNIIGSFASPALNKVDASASGAFYGSASASGSPSGGGGNSTIDYFDASLSSSVYGNSTTVQPNSVKKLLYICVGNTIINSDIVDVSKISSDIKYKAEMDLSNVNNLGSSLVTRWNTLSNFYEDLELGASETQYTAPANGWYAISKVAGSDWYYVQLKNISKDYLEFKSEYRTSPCTVMLPVAKDDVIQVDYNATGALNYFRFYYAQGEVS